MDFENLISCIECHGEEENVDVVVETLKIIINICAEEELGKDAFRDVGGLDFLLNFLTHTSQIAILEYILKVLAFVADRNVHNQIHLTEKRVFLVLQTILDKKTYPDSVLKNAVLLFSTILFQNRAAQDLVTEDECLQSLMNHYKSRLPIAICGSLPVEDTDSLEIWLNINSALCFTVNNPHNEKNQQICSVLFPLALKVVQISSSTTVIDASSSFLSLCIADNEKNQDAFAECDGFLVMKCSIAHNFEQIQSYMKECCNVVSKKTLRTVNCLIGVISAAISDHEKNASLCGKLGIIPLMIDVLSIEVLDNSLQKKIILTLGHCIDAYSDNRFMILAVPQFDILLKRILETDDDELHYATKYLLNMCLNEEDKLKLEYHPDIQLNLQKYSTGSFRKRRFKNDSSVNSQLRNGKHLIKDVHKSDTKKQNVFQLYKGNETNSLGAYLKLHNNVMSLEEKIDQLNTTKVKCKINEDSENNSPNLSFQLDKNSESPWHFRKIAEYVNKNNCLDENSRNSECNSVSTSSLQSAGHLHRLRNKLKKHGRINANKKEMEYNRTQYKEEKFKKESYNDCTYNVGDAKNFKYCSNENSRNKCVSKKITNLLINPISDKKKACKSKKMYVSFKGKNVSSNIQFDISKHKSQLPKNFSPRITSRKSKKNVLEPSNAHFDISMQSSELPEKDALLLITNSNYKSEGIVLKGISNSTDATCKFASENIANKNSEFVHGNCVDSSSINPQHSNKSNLPGSLKKSPSNQVPGCLQVIVLPGPACVKHKLAVHFEMLKVCSLENVQESV